MECSDKQKRINRAISKGLVAGATYTYPDQPDEVFTVKYLNNDGDLVVHSARYGHCREKAANIRKQNVKQPS